MNLLIKDFIETFCAGIIRKYILSALLKYPLEYFLHFEKYILIIK